MAIRVDKDGKAVVMSEPFATTQFSIAGTKLAFKALSDSIYSSKIRAIIRELSTNAYDSHVAAGKKDIPYDVHLPSVFSPYFYVRDYGVSLTPEEVHGLYTTYFQSGGGKLESNDFVGCFGIGSKSPFCYTDSFTVTTYLDGVQRDFTAYIGDDGIPAIAEISTGETVEPNGLRVYLPVKAYDIYEFNDAAKDLYQYFSLLPNIVNSNSYNYKIERVNYSRKGTGWKLRTDGGESRAIIGNIYYDIESDRISGVSSEDELLLGKAFDIHFNIGDLNVTLSRESLEYDKLTIEHLKKRVSVIRKDIAQLINNDIQNASSLWEARKLIYSMRNDYKNPLHTLASVADLKSVDWHGVKLDTLVIQCSELLGTKVQTFSRGNDRWDKHSNSFVISAKQREAKDIVPTQSVGIYEADLSTAMYSRCLKAIRDNRHKQIYLLEFENEVARKSTFETLGLSEGDIQKCSILPQPEAVGRSGPGARKAKVFEFKDANVAGGYSFNTQYDHWDTTEITVAKGGIYVEMLRYSVIQEKSFRTMKAHEFASFVNYIRKLGYSDRIFGLRRTVVKKFRESGDWISVWDFARKIVNDEIVKHKLSQFLAASNELAKIRYTEDYEKLIGVSSCEHKFLHSFLEISKLVTKKTRTIFDTVSPLAKQVGITIPKDTVISLSKLERDFEKRYPIVPMVFNLMSKAYGGYTDYRGLANYLDLVDKSDRPSIIESSPNEPSFLEELALC